MGVGAEGLYAAVPGVIVSLESEPVNLVINGTDAAIPDDQCLEEYLTARAFDLAAVVVELNDKIVPRDQWAALKLGEGDRLEIVSFVGGG